MNKNNTRTVQANEELIKKLSILAIERNTTRKQLIDQAIEEFLTKQMKLND